MICYFAVSMKSKWGYDDSLDVVGVHLVGGIIGASAGVLVIVAVSANKEWTPVLDLYVPLLAPAAGAVVGLVAGLYPSWRASRLEPVDALRSGT